MPVTYEQCVEAWINYQCRKTTQGRRPRRKPPRHPGGRPISLWTPEKVSTLCDLAAQDLTVKQIAARMGLTPMQVAGYVSRHHIQTGGGPKQVWTPERDARMRELAAQGMTTTQIAADLGLTSKTVKNHAMKKGIRTGSKNKSAQRDGNPD